MPSCPHLLTRYNVVMNINFPETNSIRNFQGYLKFQMEEFHRMLVPIVELSCFLFMNIIFPAFRQQIWSKKIKTLGTIFEVIQSIPSRLDLLEGYPLLNCTWSDGIILIFCLFNGCVLSQLTLTLLSPCKLGNRKL